ncbi:Periplasmic dipeptide transport protein precursor [Sporomusa ovata DSM 2662]|uniref:Dipeptide-binding ABC transporter, periplasmic substrate-binding component (TC 3.A.1.5.2) n=1 Tax=Sporomusa ovata TaxID=2378 RepID=A0A0U1KS69_9FIRM|nr:ABC transporter substrate-binding protein [Sporomusa ovata]EQB26205.1 periplasmic dipeptide transport protein [Sporomusa ovata DSM 2662]CQR70280.1 Dipeptide-binding ABC transporter, periplasmic substrate-binding component (TC 3.A.1.5.2) [Sporomusa ovata]
MSYCKKMIAVAIVLCFSFVFMTGCSLMNKSTSKNTLRVAAINDPGTADAQLTTEEYNLPLNIFERLVEIKTSAPGVSEMVPGLAEKWDISPDGKVYTFHLRKGVKFHNGEELTADDVVYTVDRMLNPKTKALNSDFFDMIAGAKERMDGKADTTAGIKAVDKYTVEITLVQPFAPFLANLATPAASIYNRKATEAAGTQFGFDPEKTVGTGPFKLKEWKVNDHITMVAFDQYWGGKAALDGIIVKIVPDADTQKMLFETGELDVFNCDLARTQIPYFEGSDKWKNHIVKGPRVGLYYYSMNQNIKPFDDVRVRKALQMAINRQELLDKLLFGKGKLVNTIMPPGLLGYNPNAPQIPYDPQKAKQLLTEAGYPNGFSMEIAHVADRPEALRVNEAVQAMLKEVGITVEIKQMDRASLLSIRKQGQLPMYMDIWSADFNDPDNFIYTFFAPRNSIARSYNYKNETVAAQLEQARKMTNPEERYKLYQEVETQIVINDAAWLPLFSPEHLFVVQPRVKNFKVAWNGWGDMPYYGISLDESK